MSGFDNYDDGFMDAAVMSRVRQNRTDAENKKVFDKVVSERDSLRSHVAELKAALSQMTEERDYYWNLRNKDWAAERLKHSLYVGFKLAVQDVEGALKDADPNSSYTKKSGLARSSAPSNELSYVEVLGWVKSLKELEWSLQELSGPHKDLFWSHVHKVFKFTFVPCTSPDASPVPEEFQHLLEWSRPDAELIKQYEP